MLRDFEGSFQSFVPPEQEKDVDSVELSKLRDIDDTKLNSLEKKIFAIWEDKTQDHSARYKKIFTVFFDDFCKRNKNSQKIDASVGQWIQATLERLGIAGVPISTLLRETATQAVRPEFEGLRTLFNKELGSRERGAYAVVQYVEDSVRQTPEKRLLSSSLLDRKYAVDIIEASGFGPNGIDFLCFSQIKAGKVSNEDISAIHEKHALYFRYAQSSEEKYSEGEKQQENKEDLTQMEQDILNILENIQFEILEIIEKNKTEGIEVDFEKIVTQIAGEKGLSTSKIWDILGYISRNQEKFEDMIIDEFASVLNYVRQKSIEKQASKGEMSSYEQNIITPSKSKKVVSRVVSDGRVISEIILK